MKNRQIRLNEKKRKRKIRRKKRIIANIKFSLIILFVLFTTYQGIKLIYSNKLSRNENNADKRNILVDSKNSDINENKNDANENNSSESNDSIPNEFLIDENKKYDIDDGYEYNAHSMLAIDLSNDEIIFAKNPNDRVLPASIAKLFVIDFSTNYLNLDDIVIPTYEAINSVKEGSSMAYIASCEYSVENLYAAMLVPSGNDAAFAIAEATGGKIDPNAQSFDEKINAFFKEFKKYLKQNNYYSTSLYDPSGFDYDAKSSVDDIKRVTINLLKNDWFRDIIYQGSYSATLPYGGIQTWKNTNLFLDNNTDFYSPNVKGVKTGTVGSVYNLTILYEINGKEYLIISLASTSDYDRYSDVGYLLNLIDNLNN
ncbi:MAG: hypothetical protein Q4B23_06360 [Helcococcus sp.]|nr:hypothetical protein [Helcococcus sp.]